jgi:hypothetical protein
MYNVIETRYNGINETTNESIFIMISNKIKSNLDLDFLDIIPNAGYLTEIVRELSSPLKHKKGKFYNDLDMIELVHGVINVSIYRICNDVEGYPVTKLRLPEWTRILPWKGNEFRDLLTSYKSYNDTFAMIEKMIDIELHNPEAWEPIKEENI